MYTPPPNKTPNLPQWANVNPTILHRDPVEVAKAFVLRLPQGQSYGSIGDFDSASVLMIMMRFEQFHHGDHAKYGLIKKVSGLISYLKECVK